jgi:hypothetical protein
LSRKTGLIGKMAPALALISVAIGSAVLGYQALLWLGDGAWTPILVASVIPKNPNPDFWAQQRGWEKIFDAFRGMELGGTFLLIGIVVLFIALYMESDRTRY